MFIININIKNTTLMIIIQKNKKSINICDSQRIIFEQNNNKSYNFE